MTTITEKDRAEIASMTPEQKAAAFRVMDRQTRAPIFVGDRDRAVAVRDAVMAQK